MKCDAIIIFLIITNFYSNSEILRVIDSLQLVDRKPQIATPANWVVSIILKNIQICIDVINYYFN